MRSRHISIISQPADVTQAGIIQGILAETQQRDWRTHLHWPDPESLKMLRSKPPDGLISGSLVGKGLLLRLGVPLVFVDVDPARVRSAPVVRVDDYQVGCEAARYFLELGYTRFGLLTAQFWRPFVLRRKGFVQTLRNAGIVPSVFILETEFLQVTGGPSQKQNRLREWLLELPNPVAIFASGDLQAFRVCEACGETGRRVPEDTAILGMDNLVTLCELCHPPLSSIPQPARQIGRAAVGVLEQLMGGTAPTDVPTLVPPPPVVTRQSTDVFAVADEVVRDALVCIRQHAREGLNVAELVRKLHVTRRTLERRFRKALGRSVHKEIERVRLGRACEMLLGTGMAVFQIATACGYANATILGKAFFRRFGTTPTQYRFHIESRPRPH